MSTKMVLFTDCVKKLLKRQLHICSKVNWNSKTKEKNPTIYTDMFYEHFKMKMFLVTYNHASAQLSNIVVQIHTVFYVYIYL